jgi:hypothetical protein
LWQVTVDMHNSLQQGPCALKIDPAQQWHALFGWMIKHEDQAADAV